MLKRLAPNLRPMGIDAEVSASRRNGRRIIKRVVDICMGSSLLSSASPRELELSRELGRELEAALS
jgi:hypothetical protein